MSQYQTNIQTPLYYAESAGFIAGRDPMGIQNSSVVIYARLLPGITNLTERIRFYGFYCWLLDQYDGLEEEKLSYKHQYNFIRRAELAIAFFMYDKDPDFVAIPGKSFAGDFIKHLKNKGTIKLRSGADKGQFLLDDKGERRSYWKYSSGALGQYYAGALNALSLVKVKEKYYLLQPKGKKLAEAFAESIDAKNKSTLLSIIREGELRYSDLSNLKLFDISNINVSSSEWKLYIDILFNRGNFSKPTHQRRDTLLHYLKVCDTSFSKGNWLLGEYFFQNRKEVSYKNNSASLGWYIYYTQELIHYAIEHIFNGMLILMKKDMFEVKGFVRQQTDKFSKSLLKRGVNPNDKLEALFDSTNGLYNHSPLKIKRELDEMAKDHKFGMVYCLSLMVIVNTYRSIKNKVKVFEDYLFKNNLDGRRGNILQMHTYLNRNAEKSIRLFFESFLFKILNDHQIVACNKIGNGEAQVHKFLIEHNHLIQIDHISPRMTNPRLGSVKSILEDLKLLDKQSQTPTEEAHFLLNKYLPN